MTFYKKFLVSACLAILTCSTHAQTLAPTATNPLPQNAALHRPDGIDKIEQNSTIIPKPAVALHTPNPLPNRITSTIKGDPATMRAFSWYTTDTDNNAVIRISTHPDMAYAKAYKPIVNTVVSHYAERNQNGYFIFKITKDDQVVRYVSDEGKVFPWRPRHEIQKGEKVGIGVTKINETNYQAHITELSPNTTYYYQVGSVAGGYSPIGTFKTAGGRDDAFSFIQYTDSQNAHWNENLRNEAQFAADTLKHAQAVLPDAGFVLHTGDFVEIAEVEDEWVDLLGKSQESLLKTSLVPVAGNHDEYAIANGIIFPTKFNEHFNVASAGKIDGGSYYSFDYNNAHFVVLNTNDNKNPAKKALSEAQLAWLYDDVKKARANGATWIILTYHKPLFSKGYHALQDEDVQRVRDEFMKAIDDLDIDLALQGHDHVYSRTKPLNYAPKEDSFVNAKIEDATYTHHGANIKTYHKLNSTIFMIPNTAGTKTYDAIFDRPLTHIHKVSPKLKWLTQPQLEHYNSLFEVGFQPQRSERFADNISNHRDNSIQNFATYQIDGNTLTATVYQVSGDLAKGEPRTLHKVDEFVIKK